MLVAIDFARIRWFYLLLFINQGQMHMGSDGHSEHMVTFRGAGFGVTFPCGQQLTTVEEAEFIYLQEQIAINSWPFFLCVLQWVCNPLPCSGSEIGCFYSFPKSRAMKGEGAVLPCTLGAGGAGCLCPGLLFPFLPLPARKPGAVK